MLPSATRNPTHHPKKGKKPYLTWFIRYYTQDKPVLNAARRPQKNLCKIFLPQNNPRPSGDVCIRPPAFPHHRPPAGQLAIPNARSSSRVFRESGPTAASVSPPLPLMGAHSPAAGRRSTRLPRKATADAATPAPRRRRKPTQPPSAGSRSSLAAPQHFLLSLGWQQQRGNVHEKKMAYYNFCFGKHSSVETIVRRTRGGETGS